MMAEKNYKANSGSMTPYTGGGPEFGRNPVTLVNGNRYILNGRSCSECVHSIHFVDRSPLCCRINLCDLEIPREMQQRLEAVTDVGDTALSRFFYLESLRHFKRTLPEKEYGILLKDKRILDCDDKKNCYCLTNQSGLYRVCDLAHLFRNGDGAEAFVSATFKERDKIIGNI